MIIYGAFCKFTFSDSPYLLMYFLWPNLSSYKIGLAFFESLSNELWCLRKIVSRFLRYETVKEIYIPLKTFEILRISGQIHFEYPSQKDKPSKIFLFNIPAQISPHQYFPRAYKKLASTHSLKYFL